MKIGFIKKKYSPYGGGEIYLDTLINNLKEDYHEIHIFSSQWKSTEGVNIHKIKSLEFNSALSALSFNYNAAKAIGDIKPDYVVSFERTTCGDIYRAGDGCHKEWLEIRKKFSSKLKSFSFVLNPLHRTLLGIEKKIFKKTMTIVANSNMVKKQIMKNYNVPVSRIHVIYNGVDLERFRPELRLKWRAEIRKKNAIPEDAPLVIFVGSGYERKGLLTLIKSIGDVDKSLRLLVIGRGDVKKYQNIANSYKLANRILFLGPQTDIEKFYATSDIFVLPTLYDPFSNATLEAMASGLPVITSKNNGAAELVEQEKEGFILGDMLDDTEVTEKIRAVLDNSTAMKKNARKKAEKFHIGTAASKFKKLIKVSMN